MLAERGVEVDVACIMYESLIYMDEGALPYWSYINITLMDCMIDGVVPY